MKYSRNDAKAYARAHMKGIWAAALQPFHGFRVEHEMVEPGPAMLGVVMPVIAALDEERQPIAQPVQHFGRPWPQRDHRLPRPASPALFPLAVNESNASSLSV